MLIVGISPVRARQPNSVVELRPRVELHDVQLVRSSQFPEHAPVVDGHPGVSTAPISLCRSRPSEPTKTSLYQSPCTTRGTERAKKSSRYVTSPSACILARVAAVPGSEKNHPRYMPPTWLARSSRRTKSWWDSRKSTSRKHLSCPSRSERYLHRKLISLLPSCRPGEAKKVSIRVNSTQLAVWSLSNKFVVEPGQFAIKVGTSDQTFLNTTLTVR